MKRSWILVALLALATGLGISQELTTRDSGVRDPGTARVRQAMLTNARADEITVVVSRFGGARGALTVDYRTADATAIAGEDYVPVEGTLSWAPGDRSDRRITVPVLSTEAARGLERFDVVLTDRSPLSIHEESTGIKPRKLRFADETEEDSDSEAATEEDSDSDATTEEDSDSEADSDSDCEADSDSDSASDSEADSDSDAGCDVPPDLPPDLPPDVPPDVPPGADGGLIKLTQIAYPALEGDGIATFAVERDTASLGVVTVDYILIEGSATADLDYVPQQGTLEWADGELGEKTVDVTILDDAETEDPETISIVLTNPTGGAALGMRDVASIVIQDDDGGAGACIPDATTLCLQNGRFEITGSWTDPAGATGPFNMVPSTDGSGLVWFFSPDNIELLVKVLEGCALNGHYWVFFAATTDVGFSMEVTDLDAGITRVYDNAVGVVPLAITDVTAFPTCP